MGVLDNRFGNTTLIQDASGEEARLHYKPDGTLSGKSKGSAIIGTWTLEGDTIRLATNEPILHFPNPVHVKETDHNVGDSWTAAGVSVSLLAGIQ